MIPLCRELFGSGLSLTGADFRASSQPLAALLLRHGWLESHFGGRRTPLNVIGPSGTLELTSSLERAYAADIRIRIDDEQLCPEGISILTEEFFGDGVVYEKRGLRVIAFEVDHGDVIKPAYGYRIE